MTKDPTDSAEVTSFRVHYVKSPFFRVIHVDGAYGGVNARGYINAALYNERQSIPRITEVELGPDGQTKDEKIIIRRGNAVRELEADLIFDINSARQMAAWLTRKAAELEALLKAAPVETGTDGRS